MDNASNNDTLMAVLEARYQAEGINFSAKDSRMRCMPHTIHLASLKVRIYLFTFVSFSNIRALVCASFLKLLA